MTPAQRREYGSGEPFYCYPCAQLGDHAACTGIAWVPDIPCECPRCAIPYRHGPHLVDDGRIQNQCPGGPHRSGT